MKVFCLILLLTIASVGGFAQTLKFYMKTDGVHTDDTSTAAYYVLVNKLDDTAYMATEYSIHDGLMVRGLYKDKTLSIPNGKFYYYRSGFRSPTRDTYLQESVYFVNGVKQGPWIKYWSNGKKRYLDFYENDKLNGTHQEFNPDGITVTVEGKYINDEKVGTWNFYGPKYDKPVVTKVYSHDLVIDHVTHYHPSIMYPNFFDFIRKNLLEHVDTFKNSTLQVTLFVNAKGKIDSVKCESNITAAFYKAIVKTFLHAPNLKPAIYDGELISETRLFNLKNLGHNNLYEDRQSQKNFDILLRHTNDIGRGLNSVGIGKPVN
jgi:antitoxin component YwqK of YwqJK toxin-antitoxin module